MATSFSSLPIVDMSTLSQTEPSPAGLTALRQRLYDAFSTTGFAYLINAPLRFGHEEVFQLAGDFFSIGEAEKMKLAKKTFANRNRNTYRGYFPTQAGQQDNLKEGFEIGPPQSQQQTPDSRHLRVSLSEANVWPAGAEFANSRTQLEELHQQPQTLSATLLSLLAVALEKPDDYFASYLVDSLSTLRLLHYPPQAISTKLQTDEVSLCCTPHTDSGILTLLHQDPTGGLEVLNADGNWVAAPCMPGSIVVNVGESFSRSERANGVGRLSTPFFFEPGEKCVVRSLDGARAVVYGEHIRRKMATWVEYEDLPEVLTVETAASVIPVEAC